MWISDLSVFENAEDLFLIVCTRLRCEVVDLFVVRTFDKAIFRVPLHCTLLFVDSDRWRRNPWLFFASRAHIPEVSRAAEAHGSSDSLAAPVFGTNADQHPNTS